MKLGKLITGFILSTLLAVGVGVGIGSNRNDAKGAEAYTEHHFYVVPNNKSYSIKVYYERGWKEKGTETFSNTGKTYKGYPIYSGSVWDHNDAGNFDILKIQMYNGDSWSSECVYINSWKVFDGDGKMFVFSGASTGSFNSYSEDTYQIKTGTGSYQDMTWDVGEGLPSGTVGQYSKTLDLAAGNSLSFRWKNGGSTGTISPDYPGGNNNYHNNAICVSVDSGKVFLKLLSGGSYEVWVPGYTACAVVVGGTSYTTTQSSEGGSDVYDTTTVYVDKTQTVKVSWNHIEIDTYLNGDSTSGCFTASEGTVTCSLTGAYTIRVHKGIDQHNTVYIQRVDADTAKYLAQKFNSIISSICTGITGGTKSLSDLQNAWGSNTSSDLYKHFNGQPDLIKNYFKPSSPSDSDIRQCVVRYDYIVKKYGTTALPDFLDRKNGYSANPQGRAIISIFGQSNGNSAAILIAIVSTVATVGAVAGYFFYKKKKED